MPVFCAEERTAGFMAERIYFFAASGICILFFISVFAPKQSEKKFWKIILKIRAGMDFVSYWIFNLCGAVTVVYICYYYIKDFLSRWTGV